MSQDEFTKLFKYMEEMRSEMNERFEQAAKERDEIRGSIVDLGIQIKDYHQEMLMLAHKVDRLERWIHQIAEKTGVKLSYDQL